jgi:hypothetical protein
MSVLWESILAIGDELVRRILAGKVELGITQVEFGERIAAGSLRPPFVWIAPSGGPIESSGLSVSEIWQLNFTIIGVVESNDTEKGFIEANKLAIRASSFAFINPDTGKKDRTIIENVEDMVRTTYTPAATRLDEGRLLFGAGVEIQVKFFNRCMDEEE